MNMQSLPDRQEIEEVLGLGPKHRRRRWLKRLAWGLVLIAAVAAAAWWYQASQLAATTIVYDTQPVKTGNLTVTVTATGTVQPTTQTDVSSEMSGVVRAVAVDNNSPIKKGDVLASLDIERYVAQLRSLQASLDGAKAKLADAQATVKSAELTLQRQQALKRSGVGLGQDLENAQAARDRALAAVTSAEADIEIAQANLDLKQLDIDKSQIISPVNGIVLKRNVEPGQTVASSLQAPVLFTLAEDLKRMQLEANIDEADIGSVKVGQNANFTVDAFPGRNFPARIETVQFSPETTDGVVTYKAILTVDNTELALRPGMTATAQIVVREVNTAVLIPNSALRYVPPVVEKKESFSISRMMLPRMPRSDKPAPPPASNGERTVWVLKDGTPQAVKITTGVTDGKNTEVVKGDLAVGDAVIVTSRQAGRNS